MYHDSSYGYHHPYYWGYWGYCYRYHPQFNHTISAQEKILLTGGIIRYPNGERVEVPGLDKNVWREGIIIEADVDVFDQRVLTEEGDQTVAVKWLIRFADHDRIAVQTFVGPDAIAQYTKYMVETAGFQFVWDRASHASLQGRKIRVFVHDDGHADLRVAP